MVILTALFYLVISLVILLPVVAVARIALSHGTWSERTERPEARALALALLALGGAVALPWISAVGGADRFVVVPGVILVTATIAFAARQVTGGWAVLTSIALVGSCMAAAIYSHGLAEWVGWQDLHWRETTDDPLDGSSVDIGWGLVGAIVFAPVAGIVLGIASQVNKRERAAA